MRVRSSDIQEAAGEFFNWSGHLLVVMVIGCCFGLLVGGGGNPVEFVFGAFFVLYHPQTGPAWFVTALAWYLSIHVESTRFRIGASIACFLAWAATAAICAWH